MGRGPKCDDQIIRAIENHWKEYCLPPSLDVLVDNTCIASKNTMYLALRRLRKKGYIAIVDGKAIPKTLYFWIPKIIEKEQNESEESKKTKKDG